MDDATPPSDAELTADLDRRFRLATSVVRVGGRELRLVRPENSDVLISEADYVKDERLPYWAEVWPSSVALASNIPAPAPGIGGRALLELGCGVGLVATAATLAGWDVTATDYYEDALLFTRANVRANTGRSVATRMVDWKEIPPDFPRFVCVLAADVIYEVRYATMVADVLARTLAVHGTAVIADPGRSAAPAFLSACAERGLVETNRRAVPYEDGDIRQRIELHSFQRA
jgi:predicted nicotinamide N-methyase